MRLGSSIKSVKRPFPSEAAIGLCRLLPIKCSTEDDSRKDAKHAKFGENRKIFFFVPLRLGAKIFLEIVLGFRNANLTEKFKI